MAKYNNNSITGYGVGSPQIGLAPVPEKWDRAPTVNDLGFPIGYLAVYNGTVYASAGASAGLAIWVVLGGGSSDVNTINNLSPTAGNIDIVGTANRLTVSNLGSTVTLTLPNAVSGLTSLSANSLTAASGNITATNGNIVRGTAGNKDVYTSVASTDAAGANSAGSVTLVNGTVTVATTAVTASSLIRLTRQSIGTTGANLLGMLTVGTITPATSFVINALEPANATLVETDDQSVVFWEIVN